MKKDWPTHSLSELVTSRPGNNKIIKGKQSNCPRRGLIQAFSASGPDVWVTKADYKQPGIIISAVGARCGKTFMAEGEWTAIANTHVLLPGKDIDPRWLWYRTNDEDFWIKGGAAQPFVKVKATLQRQCKVPPLIEQQRIVAILDKTFENITTTRTSAEQNLHNAHALFESYLQSIFARPGPGWMETTLGAATSSVSTGPFGSLLHKSDYVKNGIPLVNPAHITETGIEPDFNKTVSNQTAKRLSSYIMHKGDVVIGRRGEMGRCALVTENEDGWICGTGSFFIKSSDRCDPRYLVRFLRSEGCRNRLEKLASGAVMPNLSNVALANFKMALPPLVQQNAIVEEIDILSEETQHLESIYQRKIVELDALKKSLLNAAFSGKL